jgi:S-DNA-T family DNA segregation ATPase FtsK/SpoIIIE
VLGNRGGITAEEGCPGRGLLKVDSYDMKESCSLEFQTAICLKSDDVATINIELVERFKQISDSWEGVLAPLIPQIPTDMTYDSFRKYPEVEQALREGSLPIGYDIKEAKLFSLKPDDLFCYVVSGGSKSGKTNMIKLIALQAVSFGHSVTIIDNEVNKLATWAKETNITYLSNSEHLYKWLLQTIPEFSRRHKKIEEAGGRKFSNKVMADEQQMIILINDFGAFLTTIYSDTRNMHSFFENMVRHGRDHKITLVACITREDSASHGSRPVFSGFTSWKEGIHMGGQTDNQRVFDFDLSTSERMKKHPAGYGHTVEKDKTVALITPEV